MWNTQAVRANLAGVFASEETGQDFMPEIDARDTNEKQARERAASEKYHQQYLNNKNYGAIAAEAMRAGDIEEIERLEAERQDENVDNLRFKRRDGFLNRELRSLNVAAYLRVIYALIEYAPTVALKITAIRTVRTDFIF